MILPAFDLLFLFLGLFLFLDGFGRLVIVALLSVLALVHDSLSMRHNSRPA